jgi:hypothetical protein
MQIDDARVWRLKERLTQLKETLELYEANQALAPWSKCAKVQLVTYNADSMEKKKLFELCIVVKPEFAEEMLGQARHFFIEAESNLAALRKWKESPDYLVWQGKYSSVDTKWMNYEQGF